MAATNRQNAIESENEAPRLDDSKLATGEGRSTVTSTCIQNGAGGLKPQGGSPADVDAEERTVENRRSLRERMRIGTWNVRTMNQGKLDIMKREMERTGRCRTYGHQRDEMDGDGTLHVRWIWGLLLWTRYIETERCGFHMYRWNTKMCYGIQPCKWQNSNNTPAMQASKHDCLANIRSNIYSGRRRNGRVLWEGTAYSGRDTERRCAVCDRRLECQSWTGRDKRHYRKIRTGGTKWTGRPTRRILQSKWLSDHEHFLQVTCTEAVYMEIARPNHQKSDRLHHMQNEMEK